MTVANELIYVPGAPSTVQACFVADLDRLVQFLVERLGDNLISILLMGGYGRGEGSVYLAADRMAWVNDLDFVVVIRKTASSTEIEALAHDCGRLLNPATKWRAHISTELDFHVDINAYTQDDLRAFGPTVLHFDLKYASRLLYGIDLRPAIAPIGAASLPPNEGLLLLLNRAVSLLEAFSPAAFSDRCGDGETARQWAYYFSIKALTDAAAAVLLLRGRYASGRSERIRALAELARTDGWFLAHPEFAQSAIRAHERKGVITPTALANAGADWREARAALFSVLHLYFDTLVSTPPEWPLARKLDAFVAWAVVDCAGAANFQPHLVTADTSFRLRAKRLAKRQLLRSAWARKRWACPRLWSYTATIALLACIEFDGAEQPQITPQPGGVILPKNLRWGTSTASAPPRTSVVDEWQHWRDAAVTIWKSTW